jgi:hypothetical protein
MPTIYLLIRIECQHRGLLHVHTILFDGRDHIVSYLHAPSLTKVYLRACSQIRPYDDQTIPYRFVSQSEASMYVTRYVLNAAQSLASEEDHPSPRE